MGDVKTGRWRHFKGNDYEVLYNARHSESLEPMVVYRALYGEGGVWVRPASMWSETVTHNGAIVPRFTYTGDMDIVLRREEPKDHRKTESLTREAFWNIYKPGCDEHYLLYLLRQHASFIPELDYVAEQGGKIIGNIAFSRACVISAESVEQEVITFGPVGVLPEHQKNGTGSRLILHTLELAQKMGFRAVVIFGSPAYYHRFGFRSASDYGITTADGKNFDAFMARELFPGALQGISGRFHDSDVFHIRPEDADTFDIAFPPKEKKVTETQL